MTARKVKTGLKGATETLKPKAAEEPPEPVPSTVTTSNSCTVFAPYPQFDHERARNANETLRICILMSAAEKLRPNAVVPMVDEAVAFLKRYYGAK